MADLKCIPLYLDNQARDDTNSEILGLYLDLLPAVLQRSEEGYMLTQLNTGDNYKNGRFYSYFLKFHPRTESPAIDLNLKELHGAKEELILEKPYLSTKLNADSNMELDVSALENIVAISMTYHISKKDEIIRLIGGDYLEMPEIPR